jgi:hypothetical protein
VAKLTKLDQGIRDLADMAPAVKIGCRCMDLGYRVLHARAIPREKIDAMPHWRDCEPFSPLERLVMEYAEAMSETAPSVDYGLWRSSKSSWMRPGGSSSVRSSAWRTIARDSTRPSGWPLRRSRSAACSRR